MAKRRKQIRRTAPRGKVLTNEPTEGQKRFMERLSLLEYGDAIANAIVRKVGEIGRGRPAYLWNEADKITISLLVDALNNVRDCQKHLAAGVNTKGLGA